MTDHSNRSKLLFASFLTLIAAGIGFGVRTAVLVDWAVQFGFTKTELGTISGGGLVGFGIVVLFASLITDRIGYKALLCIAFVLHVLSVGVQLAATPIYAALGKDATYWCLYSAMFMFAIGNGLCEAVINPLVATLYPKQKTHYLNILHAGWPGGLIIGAVLAKCFLGESASITHLRWEIPMAFFLVPALWYGIIVLKESFPVSEARAAGVKFGAMLKNFASPMLISLLVLHACVGYVELGTDSWITTISDTIVGGQGLYLFIYASALMFILRFYAGPIVERINPLGLLCISSVLGATGLFILGSVQTAVMIWIAMTIYGLGKTFLWPTMLGVVGERFPKGGAITMGAVGGVGMLSAGLLGGPGIGYKQDLFASNELKQVAPDAYDRYKALGSNHFLFFPPVQGLDGAKVGVLEDDAAQLTLDIGIKKANEEYATADGLKALESWWNTEGKPNAPEDRTDVEHAKLYGGQMALKVTALVPAAMFVGFLILVLYFRSKGGYHAIEIGPGGPHEGSGTPSAEDAIEEGQEGPSSGQA